MNYTQLGPTAGKRLLVVGGCGGIGQAVVAGGLANGLAVAVFDLPNSLIKAPVPAAVLTFAVDATKEFDLAKAMQQLLEHWGGIDYLVNLVGYIDAFDTISAMDNKAWRKMLEGNLDSCMLTCKITAPYLQMGGAIVNMSSGLGFVGRVGYGPYTAAKAAVSALTKTLAVELAPDIRVNAVAPGAVLTPFLQGGLANDQKERPNERMDLDTYKQMVPLGTIAEPKEVAAPILFLLGPGASHITGQTIHINGGALMI